MGTSQPVEPKEITVNVILNMDSNNIINTVENDNDGLAPPPVSSLTANVQAKGEDGKNIPCKLNINSKSTNNYEQVSTNPSVNSDSNSSSNLKDNNIARNKESRINEKKNVNNNNFSIFNGEDSAELNKINDNDKEIDKNIDTNKKKDEEKNNNHINNNDNEIINNKNNDKNNFLKEGVKEVTKFGEEEKKEEEKENNQTPVGENIDMNIPRNKYEKNNELLINGKTPINDDDNEGNIDMNQGSRFNQKKENEKDNYNGLNFSDGDLSLSQSVFVNNADSLENSCQWIEKGYYPLFMKLNNYEPLLLHIREDATLVSLVKAYLQSCPETDEGIMKDLKLYHGKKLLDINKQIKDLKLNYFDIITNRMEDNNENKK